MSRKSKVLLLIACALYLFLFFTDKSTLTKALGLLFIIQLLWIGRVFPLAYSSMILILLLSFHFFTFDKTLSYFGSGLVWLLFSTFILSHAFIKTGLANRISLSILSLAKGSGKLLIFISFVLEFILTLFIPSNIGKGQLISSILDDLIKHLRKVQDTTNIGKSLFIGIAYVSSVSAAFVPTGASSTVYAFGMLSSLSNQINYLTWILYIGVPIGLFVLCLWLIFLLQFPVQSADFSLIKQLIQSKRKDLGKWGPEEKRTALITGLVLLLWLTQPLHHQPISLIALLGAVLVLFPRLGVMHWHEVKQVVDWDMMIFFASTLMLSNMLIETGTLSALTTFIINSSQDLNSTYVIIASIILTALIRIVFVNVLGYLSIMLPLAIAVGEHLQEPLSLALTMAVYLATVPGFLLITQSPVHMISYSYKHFETHDLFRVGLLAMAAWVVILILAVFLYWDMVI